MANNIPLTLRLPADLNEQLNRIAKATGITKTNLLRQSIYDYLDVPEIKISDFNILPVYGTEKHRIVLNINSYTYDILEKQSKKFSLSFNNLLAYSSIKILQYYSKLTKESE